MDHQPVHLRVMDTADPVTLSPFPQSPREGRESVQPPKFRPHTGIWIPLGSRLLCGPEWGSDFSGPESFICHMRRVVADISPDILCCKAKHTCVHAYLHRHSNWSVPAYLPSMSLQVLPTPCHGWSQFSEAKGAVWT